MAASAPQAALTPSTVSFGSINVGTTSPVQSFTLSNSGNAALPITSVALGGTNAGSFAMNANNCGASLAANKSCTIAVTFSPASAGSFSANGTLHVTKVVRGMGHGLDEAAVAAANKIRFKPALRFGQPVDSTAVVHVSFQLAY